MKDNKPKRFAKPTLIAAMCMVAIVLSFGKATAQITPRNGNLQQGTTQPADTTKKKEPKVRKPLESYFFDDSTRNRKLFSWNVNTYINNIARIEIDTMLNNFEIDYKFLREDVGDAYLGNLGGASIPLNAVTRPQYRNFSFVQAYNCYLKNPQNVPFFNVKVPFTHLSYYQSGQKIKSEDQLRVTHAQNISPSTGFNIDYDNNGTRGMYAHQRAKDKNLSVAFSHTGKRYTLHAGYIYNMADLRDNGGIQSDWDVVDTVYDDPANIPVNLTDAKTRFKGNTFYAVQSYGIPFRKVADDEFSIAEKSTVFVGHAIEYTRYHKEYSDSKDGSGSFYKNWYINPTQSYDSIAETLLDNRLFMQIQPYSRNGVVGLIDAGVGYSYHSYYHFNLDQYLYPYGTDTKKNSFYIYGAAQGAVKKYFNWYGNAQYYMLGYRNQDLTINGKIDFNAYIKKRPITLSASLLLDTRSPGYWIQSFFSNHYAWSNSFSKEIETRLEATLSVPHINMEIGVWQSLTQNKIFYNAESLPEQYSPNVSLTGVYIRKDFQYKGLHLNNRVLLQWSSAQEVIPVPLASAFASYYYEFNVVKNVLRLQIGLDGRYNTQYYAFGYNPAIAQFYNQREKKLGNYPYVDAFVSGKWKRMRILVKFQHLNEDMFGERNYFSVLHHPLNRRMFKLGFSWGFYD